jgi:thioredoxin reductase (NADPH)
MRCTSTEAPEVDMRQRWDTIIIGAGPAGLMAAIYLARYRRSTLVLHDGRSRAACIPLTHNAPGWTEGISGKRLLSKMAAQAAGFGACFHSAHVEQVQKAPSDFVVGAAGGETWRSSTLIVATGADMNQLPLEARDHERALENRVLGYCPICDGFEHIDQRIGVIGCGEHAAKEALFLSRYAARVTLIKKTRFDLDPQLSEQLSKAGIEALETPVEDYVVYDREMALRMADGSQLAFDVVYPALGLRPRSELAAALGLALDEAGHVSADSPYVAHVPGLYAAGDVVAGLDQISVATGHGAIAATKAHNWMREQELISKDFGASAEGRG